MSEETSKPSTEGKSTEGQPESKPAPEPEPQKSVASDTWDSLKDVVKIIGTWAWLVGLISGIVYILTGIVGVVTSQIGYSLLGISYGIVSNIWHIISGAINIIIALAIVLPRFSMKCKNEDWDFLLNDVLVLGNFRFPLMLLWGGLLAGFGYGWGGAAVLIPAFMLLFAGPKPYEWTTE